MKSLKGRAGSRLALFVAGSVVAIAGVVGGQGTASAHHSDVTASVSCSGIVSWTAAAWNPGLGDDVRTNPEIHIYYQPMGNDGTPVPLVIGAFNAGNNFTLSGQFTYPAGNSFVWVWAEAVGPWGNGAEGGSRSYAQVNEPSPCPDETTTTAATTTTTEATTTTTEATTTTTEATTTTTEVTTTTVQATTTSVDSETPTTTTIVATTTTLVDSESGTTTTLVSSEGPTTTLLDPDLPVTGGGGNASLPLVAIGLLMIGVSFVMTTRRNSYGA